jgi:hypothetical protein
MDGLGQGEGNEDDGGEPEDQMGDEEVSTSRVHKPLSPAVHDTYQKHLHVLKETARHHPRSIYDTLGTFWLPQRSGYFILHGALKPRPTHMYNPQFFYWDPDLLVEGGLRCPVCRTSLQRHGYTRPRRVVDLEICFYMIGQ